MARARPSGAEPVLAGGFAGLLGALVHAQVDWHWQVPALSLAMVALLAAGAALLPAGRALDLRVSRAMGLLLVLGAVLWALPGMLSVRLTESAITHAAPDDARLAARLNPLSAAAPLALANLAAARGDAREAVEQARRATEREPDNWADLAGAGEHPAGRRRRRPRGRGVRPRPQREPPAGELHGRRPRERLDDRFTRIVVRWWV